MKRLQTCGALRMPAVPTAALAAKAVAGLSAAAS